VFHSKVFVTLKKSILDPQGKAVEQGIHSLGFESVGDVRIGKYIEMDIDVDSRGEAERITREISEKLLANLVMESYSFTIEPVKEQAG
jgi:phosphoribosylformylglycinamidine synthase subunit PurS